MLKNLGKSILVYGLAAGLSRSFAILLVPIYTRIFSPADYGIIDVITTILTLAALLGSLQLESALVRFFYEVADGEPLNRLISTIFWTVLGSGLVWTAAMAISAGPISQVLFHDPKYAGVLRVAGAVIPLMTLYGVFTVIIRFKNLPVLYGACGIIQILGTIGLAVFYILVLDLGIAGAFYGMLSGFFLADLAAFIFLKGYIRWIFDRTLLVSLLKYSLPSMPAVTGTWANGHLNRFVMLAYLSLSDIGVYNVGLKLASVFYLLENAFRMAWQPFFWKTLSQPDHRRIYRDASMVVSAIVLSLVVVMALFAREILAIIAPPEYAGAAPLMGMISMAISLNLVAGTVVVGTSITKKTVYNIVIYLGAAAVNFCAMLILVPRYQLVAVPISLLAGSFTLVLVGWYYSEKMYPIGFSKSFFALVSVSTLALVLLLVRYDLHPGIKAVIAVAGPGFVLRWGWRRLMQYESSDADDD